MSITKYIVAYAIFYSVGVLGVRTVIYNEAIIAEEYFVLAACGAAITVGFIYWAFFKYWYNLVSCIIDMFDHGDDDDTILDQ